MGDVVRNRFGVIDSADQIVGITTLEREVLAAIEKAYALGVPQGMVIAVLHIITAAETLRVAESSARDDPPET